MPKDLSLAALLQSLTRAPDRQPIQNLLDMAGGTLHGIGRLTDTQISSVLGIAPVRTRTIRVALALCERYQAESTSPG